MNNLAGQEMRFAKLTEEEKNFLLGVKFSRTVIYTYDTGVVIDALKLEKKSRDELTAMRNSIIEFLTDEIEKFNDEDSKNWFQWVTTISAVTWVIDKMLMEMGAEV